MSSLILNRSWRLRSQDRTLIEDLASRTGAPEIIAAFLYHRGLRTPDEISRHLTPALTSLSDPWKMADMEPAVERLVRAVKRREHVAIFGDYDADGVTSTAILYLFLQELGIKTSIYIPHREKDGYGLNSDGIKELASKGCSLVVTVDCGVTNTDEVELARSLGLDVIVTDHHQPPKRLPRALAVINPKRKDCAFPFKELAGVGVAFNLIRALRARLYQAGHWSMGDVPNLKAYLDLVALGTIADIVPLLGDNRILTRVGLEVLKSGVRPGLEALRELCGLSGEIGASDVAFRLAPRVNAAGRMDHAIKAFQLLVTSDHAEAQALARELHGLNQDRQNQEAGILRQALRMVEESGELPAYVLSSPEWKKGVVGIVASRIVEQVGKPVLLLCLEGDSAQGSGRCPAGLNLYELLSSCAEHLTGFGGHRAAAGLKLHVSSMEDFIRAFHEAARAVTRERPVNTLDVDCPVSLKELADPVFVQFFQLLEPFGEAYDPPVYMLRGFSVASSRVVGNNHLKLILTPSENGIGPAIDLLGWSHGDKLNLPWASMDLACTPWVNTYQGQKRIQLRLKDAKYRE